MNSRSLLMTAACAGFVFGMAEIIPAAANVEIYRLTATSEADGVLGYLDYDSSSFDGSSFQYVYNTQLLDLKFVDPLTKQAVTEIGPPGSGTVIDSVGIPTVVGGFGFTGGTDFANGVYIAYNYYVDVTNNSFYDVTWSASTISGVPETSTWTMMLVGFAGIGFAGYRHIKRKGGGSLSASYP